MSGRDLFTYDASLFKDEEGAVSADEYDEREEAQHAQHRFHNRMPPLKSNTAEDPEYDDDDDGKTHGVVSILGLRMKQH